MSHRIVVIGAGPGGYVAALHAASLGAEVTVVERADTGGTCLNWGCIPSKIMKTSADVLEKMEKAREFAIELGGTASIDMTALIARKNRIVEVQRKGIEQLFAKRGVTYRKGHASITDDATITVTCVEGTSFDIPWNRIIIAVGSVPAELPSMAFDHRHILSSDDVFTLDHVPESLIIVGGGVIGCEFAGIFSSLGTSVTLVEALSRLLPLPSVDEDCSRELLRAFKKRKIAVKMGCTVSGVDTKNGNVEARVTKFAGDGVAPSKGISLVQAEKMLVCVGRSQALDGLHCEKIGVERDDRNWIVADNRMATNVPGVYAVGDALGPSKVMLAHAASAEGIVAAENAMGGDRKMDYGLVPGAIFTSPEVANVGLSETEARDKGYDVVTHAALFRAVGKAHVLGEIEGKCKIVSDEKTGRILGVHIIGPHATEIIAEGTLAVKKGVTVEDLAGTIHAHPTLSEIMELSAGRE